MNAYYTLLRQLAVLFVLLTIFTLPLMFIYSSYNGLAEQPKYFANRFAIGNMGKWTRIARKILTSNLIGIQVDPMWHAGKWHPLSAA